MSLQVSSRCVSNLWGEIGRGSFGESGESHNGIELTMLIAWRSMVVNCSLSMVLYSSDSMWPSMVRLI